MRASAAAQRAGTAGCSTWQAAVEAVDGGAVDGPAVDGVAVDGVAVDGVAVDGVAVVGAKDGTEQRSARVRPSTTRGPDAFVGAVSNTRAPTSSARVPRVPLAQPQLAVLDSARRLQ